MQTTTVPELTIVTWNVDGLAEDISNEARRCSEASRIILRNRPNVIFLQEITPSTFPQYLRILRSEGYHAISPEDSTKALLLGPYFTAAFVDSTVIGTSTAESSRALCLDSYDRIQYQGNDNLTMKRR